MKTSSRRPRISRLPEAAFHGVGSSTPPWYRSRAISEPIAFGAMPRGNPGPWAVVRVLEGRKPQMVRGGLCYEDADAMAGAMRDQTTDAQVAAGWNYLPRRLEKRQAASDWARQREQTAGSCVPEDNDAARLHPGGATPKPIEPARSRDHDDPNRSDRNPDVRRSRLPGGREPRADVTER